MLVVVANVS